LRNRVKELVYKAKYDYFNEHLNSHKQNPKRLWISVCELSGLNSTTQSPSLNDENGNIIYDPVITANLFNTHFGNIHQTVAVDKSITYTPSDPHKHKLKTYLLNIEKFNIWGQ